MNVQLHQMMYDASLTIFYDYIYVFFLFAHAFISFFFTVGNQFYFLLILRCLFQNVQTDKEYVTRNHQGKMLKKMP